MTTTPKGPFWAAVADIALTTLGMPAIASNLYTIGREGDNVLGRRLWMFKRGESLSSDQKERALSQLKELEVPAPPAPPPPSPEHITRFRGIPKNLWFSDSVFWLESCGVFDKEIFPNDYFDHSARKTATAVTREELVAMLVEGVLFDDDKLPSSSSYFDVPLESRHAGYIGKIKALGFPLLAPDSSQFGFGAKITRSNLALIALAFSGFPNLFTQHQRAVTGYVDVGQDPSFSHLYMARLLGLMTGDGGINRFRPSDFVNRVEAAKVVARLRASIMAERGSAP